ncbi:hypothetical protein L1887_17668 [Cichorium endivia]|nr:hypothetical protein L1887_17668 [Cichorium endivia]
MASKKNESESIALLSMYGDEDDDIEEDVDNADDNNTDDNAIPTENKQQSESGANETVNMEEGSIVDYGHDEAVILHSSANESVAGEEALNNMSECGQKEINPLNKFLPSPPTTRCCDELQEKLIKFRMLKKKRGRSFNSEVRNRKEYRNPDFLTQAVTYQNIDEIGTCFIKI